MAYHSLRALPSYAHNYCGCISQIICLKASTLAIIIQKNLRMMITIGLTSVPKEIRKEVQTL